MRLLLLAMVAALLGGCITNTDLTIAAASGGGGGSTPPRRIVLIHRPAPVFIAASGKRSRLATMFSLNPDCSLNDYLTVNLLSSPTHGTASVERGHFFPNYASNNAHSVCNSKPADGTAVWYESVQGYVGNDAVELEVIRTDGRAGRFSYHIEVK